MGTNAVRFGSVRVLTVLSVHCHGCIYLFLFDGAYVSWRSLEVGEEARNSSQEGHQLFPKPAIQIEGFECFHVLAGKVEELQ